MKLINYLEREDADASRPSIPLLPDLSDPSVDRLVMEKNNCKVAYLTDDVVYELHDRALLYIQARAASAARNSVSLLTHPSDIKDNCVTIA